MSGAQEVDWRGRFTGSVDRFLDSSPAFSSCLRQAFREFQDPPPPTSMPTPPAPPTPTPTPTPAPAPAPTPTAAPAPAPAPTPTPTPTPAPTETPAPSPPPPPLPMLPPRHLLPALNSLLQKLTEGVDPKACRLSLRHFTYYDIQAVTNYDPSFVPYQPISFENFELVARQAFKNMALEKSKRLGMFFLGGIMAIHILGGIVEKIPYIGKHVRKITRIIMPTPIMGPLLGFVGATCYGENDLR